MIILFAVPFVTSLRLVVMGGIWSLLSLVKNAKHAVGSFQELQGQAAHAKESLNQVQQDLVQKDYDRAVSGNPQAQFEMGERFYQGLGVGKDYATAAAWFELAAKQGHPNAQRLLAMMLFVGRGVSPDPVEAYKWIHLASLRGEEEALQIKRKMAAKIPAEAIAEGEKRATRLQAAGPAR